MIIYYLLAVNMECSQKAEGTTKIYAGPAYLFK